DLRMNIGLTLRLECSTRQIGKAVAKPSDRRLANDLLIEADASVPWLVQATPQRAFALSVAGMFWAEQAFRRGEFGAVIASWEQVPIGDVGDAGFQAAADAEASLGATEHINQLIGWTRGEGFTIDGA